MTFYVLPESCRVHSRIDVRPLTAAEKETDQFRDKIAALDASINSKIGDHRSDADIRGDFDNFFPSKDTCPDDDDDFDEPIVPIDESLTMPEADDFDYDAYDGLIEAEVRLNRNGVQQAGRVVSRKTDKSGRPFGGGHANPLLDTREYVVEFLDCSSKTYTTNLII